MPKYKVLSTKKISPSLKLSAKEHGIDIIEKEFISIHPILTTEKYNEVYKYIIREHVYAVFTSANAVAPFQKYLHQNDVNYMVNWKIFCLSNQTKKALFPYFSEENIVATAENASALANEIIALGINELVFFCGNKRRDELPEILKKNGVKLQEVIVYETTETPSLITDNLESILFFSPSAVKSFFSVNKLNSNTVCFAIGETTAEAITGYAKNKIIISATPGQEEMIRDLIQYYTNVFN
ncbi:MAG TPA: uroporphyrinogen-III synthase [Flavisolibacter sp.]|jgi:uroporphyrinogen-III synthase|nr:uroporphyrinogen-III synthase [Flavisolibacter sp.]